MVYVAVMAPSVYICVLWKMLEQYMSNYYEELPFGSCPWDRIETK